ncbi:MAG: cyclase family protein [Kiloniellales bacterium]
MTLQAKPELMSRFIDLSHELKDGMTGPRVRLPDGTLLDGRPLIRPWLTREQSAAVLKEQASFEISEMRFVASTGTYLDSPYGRYPDGRDIADLRLDELVLPGVAFDLRERPPGAAVGPEILQPGLEVAGAAVLFNFGWDRHWGTEAYRRHPHISPALADRLVERGARLLAFDTGNADAPDTPAHPVHSSLLAKDVLIAENLTGIERLHGLSFRFFVVPVKGRRVSSMPVRAFAEIL